MHKIMTYLATWTTLLVLSFWTPANAATLQKSGSLASAKSSVAITAVTNTDLSARRYYRRYRPYYGYRYRPYYYGPGPYAYGYYRPYYYRPYYAPPPFPFFGFPFF